MKVRKNSRCHYCGREAVTRDHIVPKSIIVQQNIRYIANITNFVPSCTDCNTKKASFRSDCSCDICIRAWLTYGPVDLVEVVKIQQFRVNRSVTFERLTA